MRRRSLRSSSQAAGAALERVVAVEVLDRLLERLTLDEPHRVIGPAAGIGAQAIDRDDTRVLESAGDLGFCDEALAADRVVSELSEDLLERHLAVQFDIQGHEHLAKPAPRMRPQDAEPLAIAGGSTQGEPGGAVGVVVIVSIDLGGPAVLGHCDPGECRLDLGLAQVRQARTSRSVGGDGGQALLDVAPMGFDVDRRECLEGRRLGPVRSPRASRWSARLFDLSRVQAWKAAKSGPGQSDRSEERAIRRGGGSRRRQSRGGSDRRRLIGRRPRLRGRPANQAAAGQLSQIRLALASVPRGVFGHRRALFGDVYRDVTVVTIRGCAAHT